MAQSFTNKYTKDNVLQEFIGKASRTITDMGIDAETASKIAISLARQISKDWGGQIIYITKRQARMSRDLQIYTEFTGNNHDELAARYGLSWRMIYNIIEEMKCHLKATNTNT